MYGGPGLWRWLAVLPGEPWAPRAGGAARAHCRRRGHGHGGRGCQRLRTRRGAARHVGRNKLERAWRWDGDEEIRSRSMGSHNMVCGDVDEDGKDEILLGSCMLDDNGTLLWSTGLGHPDKIYLTDIDPDRPGMEVFLCLEPWHENGRGVCVVDARTGQPVWNIGHKAFPCRRWDGC